jgi:peptide/nickel transport system permease protein
MLVVDGGSSGEIDVGSTRGTCTVEASIGGIAVDIPIARRLVRSSLLRLVLKRLVHAIPVMLGVTFVTFALLNLLPGGTALALAGPNASPKQVKQLAATLHLNDPFLTRYWHWLIGVLHGNLGTTLTSGVPNGSTVASVLKARFPVTLELVLISVFLSCLLAVIVAVLSVYRPNGMFDRISMLVAVIGLAIPNFVLAILLVLVFAVHLQLLPALGFVPLSQGIWANLKTIILPCVSLAFPLFCVYTRVLRADLLDQIYGEDYIITARSKGLRQSQILIRHALRNSVLSLVTIVGLNIGVLLGGTVLIEQIFSLPGMGQALISAVQVEDITVVEGIVVVEAAAVVLTSLLTDIAYVFLDPRIRYGSPSN